MFLCVWERETEKEKEKEVIKCFKWLKEIREIWRERVRETLVVFFEREKIILNHEVTKSKSRNRIMRTIWKNELEQESLEKVNECFYWCLRENERV